MSLLWRLFLELLEVVLLDELGRCIAAGCVPGELLMGGGRPERAGNLVRVFIRTTWFWPEARLGKAVVRIRMIGKRRT